MEDPNRNLSPCGTQIGDLPSCLIIDILVRLPIKSLAISRLVCKSWLLLFSDPLFVALHRARSPSYLFRRKSIQSRKFWKSRQSRKFCCTDKERGEESGENFEFEANVTLPCSEFKCLNSSNGLLCLENCNSHDEIYVCNPVLGEYITIPIGNANTKRWSVLGFCSRTNKFKVLQINGSSCPYTAEIYTIGDGTRHWKSIGIAPTCMYLVNEPVNTLLNGLIHWIDTKSHNLSYFNFESEQFGSLPLPPGWSDGRFPKFRRVRVGVVNGCLCIHASVGRGRTEFWVMKESWTLLFALCNSKLDRDHSVLTQIQRTEYYLIVIGNRGAIYNPSFVSLQDVAKGEQLTVMSRTRNKSKTVPWERLSGLRSRFFKSLLKFFPYYFIESRI